MAGSSLFLLLDDIAAALDDIAVMTKVAAKQTAGVLGDDLALNAQQVAGVEADRELPVVWAVAKGSLINKAILVPAALLISAFIPWLIVPLLMIGGAYLCYEGVEKLAHKYLVSQAEESQHQKELAEAVADPSIDMIAFEQEKIKGAIRTDFVLSAEIIVITLGSVANAEFMTQVAAVVLVALLMTVGVYGFVALIVKLDDMGLYLLRKEGQGSVIKLQHKVGKGLLLTAPVLMKILAVLGTVAMFLVGGGILLHGMPFLAGMTHYLEQLFLGYVLFGGVFTLMSSLLLNFVIGVLAGAVVLAIVTFVNKALKRVI
jgi:uncharacterized protein